MTHGVGNIKIIWKNVFGTLQPRVFTELFINATGVPKGRNAVYVAWEYGPTY
jgi:hypothetical protein